ncbi:MAG: cob(I)yrinic acid a,c-diamide adenosyltransferase [Planctomycetaceae bacterium]|nr:cob(I)yrinic acid a,c-diamide adenosyltransferase [Planctomycetaceae bacterium]
MVVLSKIYTRTGDDGRTSIGDGTRVSKLDARIIAGGSIDETNSHIGMALTLMSDASRTEILSTIQQRLFDLGADVCCPRKPESPEESVSRISHPDILWLEKTIDNVNAGLTPLQSFILPGGTPAAAALHVARSVCRRAERDVLTLQAEYSLNPQVPVFLNRLSDLLFVLARDANDSGHNDVLWIPRQPS